MHTKHFITFSLLAATALALTACAEAPMPKDSELQVIDTIVGDSKIKDLVIEEVKAGNGATASAGQTVSVHYTGWLYDPSAANKRGTKFDSSRDRGQPFQFPLGGGRVIKGWDKGVSGMQVGGQRTLIIPPHMAYGSRGAGSKIPPNATLIFDVELLGVQ
ncbi:MAG: peptidylprolyl isomerase [Thiotrichales bacterium]|nr:MAG: peptidylprolyl isomerase [Thiotrichales bacterium]